MGNHWNSFVFLLLPDETKCREHIQNLSFNYGDPFTSAQVNSFNTSKMKRYPWEQHACPRQATATLLRASRILLWREDMDLKSASKQLNPVLKADLFNVTIVFSKQKGIWLSWFTDGLWLLSGYVYISLKRLRAGSSFHWGPLKASQFFRPHEQSKSAARDGCPENKSIPKGNRALLAHLQIIWLCFCVFFFKDNCREPHDRTALLRSICGIHPESQGFPRWAVRLNELRWLENEGSFVTTALSTFHSNLQRHTRTAHQNWRYFPPKSQSPRGTESPSPATGRVLCPHTPLWSAPLTSTVWEHR